MKVEIAQICGLCMGCKKAIDTTIEKLKTTQNVVLLKEIVHNQNVNKKLTTLGAKIVDNLNNLNKNCHVVLRAHGEPPSTYDFLNKNGINFTDCTCENVKIIHKNIQYFSSKGYTIILVGKYGINKQSPHPEVVGSGGWATGLVIPVETFDDLSLLSKDNSEKYFLTYQTTFSEEMANKLTNKIKSIINKKSAELIVENSLCQTGKIIKKHSIELAKNSDLMIVVGSKNSSNTKELFECLNKICPTIYLEDINNWQEEFSKQNIVLTHQFTVGITAGASTQKSELFELKHKIEQNFFNMKW